MRVLVVNGDATGRDLYVAAVREAAPEAREVRAATSAEEALEWHRAEPFDAVLADDQLGRGNGLDLLETFLHETPRSLRVLLTRHASVELAIEALRRARVHGFVPQETAGAVGARLAPILAKRTG